MAAEAMAASAAGMSHHACPISRSGWWCGMGQAGIQ